VRALLFIFFSFNLWAQPQIFSEAQFEKLVQRKVVKVYRPDVKDASSGFFLNVPAGYRLNAGLYFVVTATALGEMIDTSARAIPSAENIRFVESIFLENRHLGTPRADGALQHIELPLANIFYSVSSDIVFIPIDDARKSEFFPKGDGGMVYGVSKYAMGQGIPEGEVFFSLGYAFRKYPEGEAYVPHAMRFVFQKVENWLLTSGNLTRVNGKPIVDPKALQSVERDTILHYRYTHPARALGMGMTGGPVVDQYGNVVSMVAYVRWGVQSSDLIHDPIKNFHLFDGLTDASALLGQVLNFPRSMELHFGTATRALASGPLVGIRERLEMREKMRLDQEGVDVNEVPVPQSESLKPEFQGEEGLKNNDKVSPVL
jgi:hypothetical protein